MLKESGVQQWVFEEEKIIKKINFDFKDK